ncbi:hypothetical protein [Amycolatopsis sp. GM8]|uniref:hypothetical protein n=1 Tax=Amycolatopsis sp. GM8 TaxID=2896530 RepID=UPI001F350213|nr:hypothetical protein [Amycolatopsis sp. GM8]
MSWAEERRANKLTEAQIRREEAAAAAQVRIAERAAAAAQRREDEQARAEQARADKDRRGDTRRARMSAVRSWLAERTVELLIYPVALLSFVLAAPAMAVWGRDVYGSGLGVLLPGITELGMWAFAIAVLVSRRRHPERPVGWLQAGVGAFAAVAFAANLLHGLESRWEFGVVMGVVSVAGVGAHQLTLATPLRSRTERTAARIERAVARKVTRVRRAAVRHAVAEIAADGTARLVFAPGRYVLAHRGRLESAIVPGLPVAGESADWDRELADLLAVQGAATATGQAPQVEGDQSDSTPPAHGGVATLDPDQNTGSDLHESTPTPPKNTPRIDRRPGRSFDQLRSELATAVEAGTVDPGSAESIRKTLRCSAANARRLRDDHREGDRK